MKRCTTLLALFLFIAIAAEAQHSLPEKFMLMGGGGLALSSTNQPEMDAHDGPHLGYTLSGGTRFYASPILGLGLHYDYMRVGEKLLAHNFGPEMALSLRKDDNKSAWTMLLGLGCMNYQQQLRTKQGARMDSNGDYFFSASIGMEYNFHVGGICSGAIYAKMLGADLFVNPDFRIANPDPDYDDGEYHGFFDCHKVFLNIGLAICLGR